MSNVIEGYFPKQLSNRNLDVVDIQSFSAIDFVKSVPNIFYTTDPNEFLEAIFPFTTAGRNKNESN